MTPDRFKPFFAVYLIFRNSGKILLLRRFNTGYMDGNYSMVAGHVDEGESYITAAIREAKEEAGVDIEMENLKLAFINHNTNSDRTTLSVYFEVIAWKGEIYNAEPHKCDDLSWFNLDDLPENTVDHVRYVIQQIRLGKNFGEFGWN